MEEWCVSDGTSEDWVRVCQYPRAPPGGARIIPSHQVVVRGHGAGENACASGADLHVDKMDGGFGFGGCITFFGDAETGNNQWRDFAIFNNRDGGIGASVRVLNGDWICALCCRYNSHLHGTVFNMDCATIPTTPVSSPVLGLHIVSYNLKMIETFVERVAASAAPEQRRVVDKLDKRLRNIARREELDDMLDLLIRHAEV